MSTWKKRPLVALAAVALSLAAAIPATATTDGTDGTDGDELAQVVDPNQAQGTGQVVRDARHVDFGPTLNTGEWMIEIHDDTESPSYWRRLEDVVLKVNDTAILPVPESEEYSFLGQEPGKEVWVVPQNRKDDVIWVGWNTQEPMVLDSLQLGTTLSVVNVEGPGDVIAYLQSGNFGAPEVLFTTLEPLPQQTWIEVNTHTHANWVFTEPGAYLMEVQFDGELTDGTSVSARDTLRFAVGDETDPQQVFGMVLADSGEAAQPTGQAAEQAAPEPDSGLGMVVWIVVGAIAASMMVAVIVVTVASRRARERALASRATEGRDA